MNTPNVSTPEPRKNNEATRKSPSVGQRKPGLSGQHGLSLITCVRTLTQITISRRGLLNLEMAVGLAIFLDAGKADKASKGMLAEVYAKAGYDCAKSDGKDYKTVNRRIGASSALFGKLGLEVINHWAADRGETKLLQALAQRLVELNFSSLDDVLDYAGRVSNRTAKKEEKDAKPGTKGGKPAHAETSAGGGSVVSVKTPWNIEVGEPGKEVVISLPPTLTEGQLVELASKILALAETVREAVGGSPDALDTLADGIGRERRQEAVVVQNERRAA